MQLDQETLTPVIIAMLIYITAVVVVPKIVRKPTGIQFIDDIVMTLITQKDSLMSGTVIIGLIVLATNYIQEELM